MQCVERTTSSPGVRGFVARDRTEVLAELRVWAAKRKKNDRRCLRNGLFGSYATGRYGPGSDLDILMIVESSPQKIGFVRAADVGVSGLSRGADFFVNTKEAIAMERESAWFRHILSQMVWP